MRQAKTAARVYRSDIQPTLEPRHVFVRAEIEAYLRIYGEPPTGQELLASIRRRHPDLMIDVNGVRPRCFEMREAGWLKQMPERACSVTGKKVMTWTLSTPSARPRVLEPEQPALW